jgi:hypothetical protein
MLVGRRMPKMSFLLGRSVVENQSKKQIAVESRLAAKRLEGRNEDTSSGGEKEEEVGLFLSDDAPGYLLLFCCCNKR